MYAGVNKIDLTKDTVYTHPKAKQCTGGDCNTISGYTYSQIISNASSASTKFASGHYTGNGSATRQISVGFTPKAVFVVTNSFNYNYTDNSSTMNMWGGLSVTGSPVICYDVPVVTITNNGFIVYYGMYELDHGFAADRVEVMTNSSDIVYHYVAWP